jgi:hypothetical protein
LYTGRQLSAESAQRIVDQYVRFRVAAQQASDVFARILRPIRDDYPADHLPCSASIGLDGAGHLSVDNLIQHTPLSSTDAAAFWPNFGWNLPVMANSGDDRGPG